MGNQLSPCYDCLAGNRVGKPRGGSEILAPVTCMMIKDTIQSKGTTETLTNIPGDDIEPDGPEVHRGFLRSTVVAALAAAEGQFFKSLQVDPHTDPSYEMLLSKNDILVYTKDTERGFEIRSEWRTPHFPPKLLEAINLPIARSNWDKHVQHMIQVADFPDGIKVLHIEYKKSFPISARDLLIACKTYQTGEDWVDISCSVTSEEFLPGKDVVRATLELGGYSFTRDEKAQDWKVISISEAHFGGSVPMSLVKKMSAANVPKFVETLDKVCRENKP